MRMPAIAEINATFLQNLISSETPESKHLEFKEAIHGNKDSDIKEFLADVASMANTAGGLLIFGISEKRNDDNSKTGIADSIVGIENGNIDEIILRLESQIRDGISPRIKVQTIPIEDINRNVVVIRIPYSYSAPHMVTFKGNSKFFARNSAGKYQLDVHEIRNAFIGAESIFERIRNFRLDRLAKIEADETPVRLKRLPRFVAHIIPLSAFHHTTSNPIIEFNDDVIGSIMKVGGCSRLTYNFDGVYCTKYRRADESDYYWQIFRNGIIEVVDTNPLSYGDPPKPGIPCVAYEREFISEFKSLLGLSEILKNEPPLVLMVSLLNVKGIEMLVGTTFEFTYGYGSMAIDRDSILIPELFVNSYELKAERLLRPIFDTIWQACGFKGSFNYDDAGKWVAMR